VRQAAAVTVGAGGLGLLGGLVFWLARRQTHLTVALAYGCWFAAAALLVLMAVAAQRVIWRRTTVPLPEGWVFVASACALIAVGAAIDAA